MNIYKQISEWLSNYEPISDEWIYFNVSNYEAGLISLNSVSMSRYLKKDILGNKTVEFVFSIDMMKLYDTGTADTNLDAIQEVVNFGYWIENQDFPYLGENIKIEKIELMNNVPTISIDKENNVAKYQFDVKITYLESEVK